MTDDRRHQLWVAAGDREQAMKLVLNAIPEGWVASVLSNRLSSVEVKVLNLKIGEARELARPLPPSLLN